MVAATHDTVKALEIFRTESPQRPTPFSLLCQMPEGVNVYERFLLGFAAETLLILHIKTAMQLVQAESLFVQLLRDAVEGVVVVVVKARQEDEVEDRLLPVKPITENVRKPYGIQ